MNKKSVHICLSDTGWILEKLAIEIAQRLPYVSFDLYPNSQATIQYYITYGCRQQRISPIEVALFTHKEQVLEAAMKFDNVANEVNFCIAQSLATEQIIRDLGVNKVRTISPGVNLERFNLLVKIGVIGRTYHTGRKGEALVAAVMDIPGIEWHFTGSGWPGPAEFIAADDLPAFYRSLDYVLVPALIEGGPMCVIEALACGCKVIAPPVGWVPQFPHIEFKLGDVDDLRRVLLEVVEEKAALRRSVETYTWDAFAQQHHELFKQLLGRDPLLETQDLSFNESKTIPLRAIIAVHGRETSHFKGGPSVRAPKTAAALRCIGVDAKFVDNRKFSAIDTDVLHVLNVWQPTECETLLQQIEKANKPIVLSPVFLDLSEHKFFSTRLHGIFTLCTDVDEVYAELNAMQAELNEYQKISFKQRVLPPDFPDYYSWVRRLTTYANHLIVLSEHELKLLQAIGVTHPSVSIIKNPVEASAFNNGDPKLFQEKFNVSNYVLCAGRIELRKNQALLALALRDTNIPLVLIGDSTEPEYLQFVRKWGGDNVIFVGYIEPHSAMLASAYAGARVFCLPSWSEGAPLVALEAAAAGCNMVLSDRSSESEYFGELARYINPADPNDIRLKILDSYNEDANIRAIKSQQLKALVIKHHSWEHYAKQTLDAYLTAQSCKLKSIPTNIDAELKERQIFLDLTSLVYHDGPLTGIQRVEDRLAHELHLLVPNQLHYVFWNSTYQKFLEINKQQLENTYKIILRKEGGHVLITNHLDRTPFADVKFRSGDLLVIFGGAWIRNEINLNAIENLKHALDIIVVPTIYDVIQDKLRILFPQAPSDQFSRNCARILSIADFIFTCSKSTSNDIVDFCLNKKITIPPMTIFRLGDEAASIDPAAKLQLNLIEKFKTNPHFVLFVSSMETRKNHRLLFELWRRLITEYGDSVPTLVLVGRIIWGGHEIVGTLNADNYLKAKVVWLQGVNDRTLTWLYKNCLFTVYPSLYEGWGLPVAESLMHGKFCISSDGGSLSEVGPGLVEYISPLDFMGWYRAVVKYCFYPNLLATKTQYILNHYQPTTWSFTANQVMSALKRIPISPRIRLEPLTIEKTISFIEKTPDGAVAADKFKLGGWGRCEASGSWSDGTRAILGLQLDQKPTLPLALHIDANGYVPNDVPVQVTMVINGTTLARWFIDANPTTLYTLIPATLIDVSCNLRIEFLITNPRMPQQFDSKSSDQRLLGIKIRTISLHMLMQLNLNTWSDTPELDVTNIIISVPTNDLNTTYLGLAIDPGESTALKIEINDKKVYSFTTLSGENCIKLIHLNVDIFGKPDLFPIKLIAKDNNKAQLKQVGLFTKPPQEFLLRLLQKHSAFTNYDNITTHVPYAGKPPIVTMGEIKVQDLWYGLIGGWHQIEVDGVFTNGHPASIYLQPSTIPPHGFVINLTFHIYRWLLEIDAGISIKIGNYPFVSLLDNNTNPVVQRKINIPVSDALDAEGRLAITLKSKGAIAPYDVDDSIDNRVLAIKLCEISIQPSK